MAALTYFVALVLSLCTVSSGLECYSCRNASPKICKEEPGTESCSSNTFVCHTKVRNDDGVLSVTKGCRNKNACQNNAVQNRLGCPFGEIKGQCYYCCDSDKCNTEDQDFKVAETCESWQKWGKCSRDCGYGIRRRQRECYDYDQKSVSGGSKSKSKYKAKSKKCDSQKSKSKSKSKSKNKCSYETHYGYSFCNEKDCQVQQCYSCNTSSDALLDGPWNCKADSDVKTCQSGQDHCLYTYWKGNHGIPQVAKRCADKKTCDLYIGDVGLSGKCALMVYEIAKDKITSGTDSLTIEDIINFDDITYMVQKLDTPCHVCCKGGLCNEGLLPPFSTLYPASGAATVTATSTLFILAAFYL